MNARYWKIKVDQDILDEATRQHSGRCMVAQAVRKKIPGAESVDVTADTIKFNLDETRFNYQVPGKAGKQIVKFDDEGPKNMKPFDFQLDARTCQTSPVVKHGPRKKKAAKAVKRTDDPTCRRQVVRRRHGLKVVE